MEVLAWIETLGVSAWVRESPSLLAYPTVLFLHTAGLAIVVGVSAADALRVLAAPFAMPAMDLALLRRGLWIGFSINALSGLLLLMADATTKVVNPVFSVKLIFVAAGMAITLRLGHPAPAPHDAASSAYARRLAALSLLCWAGAITAGRFMAYVGQ
jgi:hypothetical protein